MIFRRVIEIEQDESPKIYSHQTHQKHILYKEGSPDRNKDTNLISTAKFPTQILTDSYPQEIKQQTASNRKRKREYARDDDLELDLHLENIRRVRIQTVSRGVTERFEVMFGYFEEGGKPEPAFCHGFRTKDVGHILSKLGLQRLIFPTPG
jgi:hypothetical protein